MDLEPDSYYVSYSAHPHYAVDKRFSLLVLISFAKSNLRFFCQFIYLVLYFFYKKQGLQSFDSSKQYTVLPSTVMSSAVSPSLFKIIVNEINGLRHIVYVATTTKAYENLPGCSCSCLGREQEGTADSSLPPVSPYGFQRGAERTSISGSGWDDKRVISLKAVKTFPYVRRHI